MNAKKCASLLLSATLLAGSLSGCNRTIIEHQFHTNTEYITETVVETEVVEEIIDYSTAFRDFEVFLNNKNIRLKFLYMQNILGMPDKDMEMDGEVTDEEMQEWLKTPKDEGLLNLVGEVDAGILLPTENDTYSSYRLLEKTLEHIEMYYDAFQKVDETEWKNFPGVGGTLVIDSEEVRTTDGHYYVDTTIYKWG